MINNSYETHPEIQTSVLFVSFFCFFQSLLSTEILGQHPGMFEIVNNFLIPGAYAREKGQFARKVSWQLHPQLCSVLQLCTVSYVLRSSSKSLSLADCAFRSFGSRDLLQ